MEKSRYGIIPVPVPECGKIRDCIRDPDGCPAVESKIDTV